ncbi:MAG: oxidoreductase [Rhodospirillales bacterium SCN 65-16]|uniref:NAD(P)-dependent oxidoreductase n=1 Tax=Bosea sp. (in: a-proteobacteria) TaxID=1871050 RepID=UPI0008684D0B|nr:NAD(P)-dependent oxidoreductase [Bosea sp. (in: a-proteobacteria)]MBN9469366.1 NAD(P)-dependent oxidoreductase [Bosea sp. (in: a-proteobacteria)]ODT99139.1 MAG: oxidoreductase [Rhodospirillales bacterium SCN 65-16]
MRVGFIGLGVMGLPMLENLAGRPDLDLVAFDRAAEPLKQLEGHPSFSTSLRIASAPAEFADREIVVTILPDSTITNAVILGSNGEAGLLNCLQPGAMIIDMGSSNPVETGKLAQAATAKGIALIDAPVSGAVVKARSGTLAILVGGDDAEFQRARPVLEAMGTAIIRSGRVGSAHAMKALNNYVYAAGLLAVSETLAMARALDLDVEVFADVLNASSGRNVASETKLKQFMIPETFAGGFALRLMEKDLRVARSLQETTGLHAPELELCASIWRDALAELGPRADNTEVYRHVAALRGTREG